MIREYSGLWAVVVIMAGLSVGVPMNAVAQLVFKCQDENGNVIYSQTECGNQQSQEWVEPISDSYGGQGGRIPSEPESQLIERSDPSSPLKNEISQINRSVDGNISAIKSSGRKVNNSRVFNSIVEMELNRLLQIASLPVSSAADKEEIISGINSAASKAMSFIDSSKKVNQSTRFEAESSIRTSQSELISAVRNL